MSLAPDPVRIGLGRLFTSQGVDPYAEVMWERRDARITNHADGTVAFEQPGVEFPADWSQNAVNIVAQKYFRGPLGTPQRESSLRQVADRVVDTITRWGLEGGYFDDDAEAAAFSDELKYIIVTQRAAFNSPVWFNIGVDGVPQQSAACFILDVDDTMGSILEWYRQEGIIFKGGSGAGTNLSKIRSSVEPLAGGGTASGPVSFMRGADASAGTIKSGGKTRRAAKMVLLNADHPDIEEFVWCKAIEERKARALSEAGFDMSLDGRDAFSLQYQNANNSVRVTDEFMQAVVEDDDWELRAVTTGEVVRTVGARDLWRQIAAAAWECADPGIQFDTTINRWHTAANTGPINASNPCFTGDTLVHTDKGLVRFDELVDRVNRGEEFAVYTHDATNPEEPAQRAVLTTPEALMITGRNPIVRLRFSNGMELRCTPSHRIFTTNRGYVAASELTAEDRVRTLDVPTPAVNTDWVLPVSSTPADYWTSGDRTKDAELRFPEAWSEEFAHYLGWLIGDGSTSGHTTSTIYGSVEDRLEILPMHEELVRWINGDRPLKLTDQPNGTTQLRLSRRAFKRFLEALGVKSVTGAHKTVPWSIEQAPPEIVAAFLRGLFDADGCAVSNQRKGSYVGLGSISIDLLRGVQRLLTSFGISSRIHKVHTSGDGGFSYQRKDGTAVVYRRRPSYDLRITSASIQTFASQIGFQISRKAEALASIVRKTSWYRTDTTVQLVERIDDGVELTYNLSEPRNHSYIANGVVVRNCSEFVHLDNSACNLASINLLKFLDDDRFDVEAFRHTVEIVFTAQEILVGPADYPTEAITRNAHDFRQLGLGYTNLGALLMALGLPYDSVAGRAWAAAITSLMTGHAYATSARTAARMGPFAGFAANEEHMLRVVRMHRDAAERIEGIDAVPEYLVSAGREAWDAAVRDGEEYGVRNSQATVLAPTGCLVGGSLITTDRGILRLRSLGQPDGFQWQDLDVQVLTDDGPRAADKFYVNGLERIVEITTRRGHQIRGTATHRIKVVDRSGQWVWRRLSDLHEGDLVPLALGQLIGEPQEVWLPQLAEKLGRVGEHHVSVPDRVSPELAELVGYFMGDGSLHSRGLRLCVAAEDLDVVEHLTRLGKELFGIEALRIDRQGYISVELNSVRLVDWWHACGFAKLPPADRRPGGKGYVPHIPDALLHSNDPQVYRAFIRGLFEADGTVTAGYPHWMTAHTPLAADVQALLLALGYPTTRRQQRSQLGSRIEAVRLLNRRAQGRWMDEIGFISERKSKRVDVSDARRSARYDHIPVTRALLDRAVPTNGRDRRAALMEFSRTGAITRRLASRIYEHSGDKELGHLLGFFFDMVDSSVLGGEELTYDLSVPSNVTYVANGFVSHNTISFMMDADTTGVEPDLSLVKSKKLVGGGTMSIVNQTVPRALRHLGYDETEIADIVAHVDAHKSILGAPHLSVDHLPVFACSMGDNPIDYEGHVRMLAAVQPFLSGAVSKTTNLPETVSVEDVERLHLLAWELGLKSIAIYRDNCKVGQPLATAKPAAAAASGGAEVVERVIEKVVHRPVREKLPRNRRARTFEFRVADCKGFATIGEYDDGRPGEVFLTVSKQGSTLAGIMDAFAKSISYGLQYGVPLRAFVEAFTNMRFEPAGMTDDPEIRFASSVMDYLFRKLAMEYMTYDERAELSIFSVTERMQPTLPGLEEAVVETTSGSEMVADPKSVPSAADLADQIDAGIAAPVPMDNTPAAGVIRAADAPMCMQCGVAMVRAGACHACPSCGTTSGCG